MFYGFRFQITVDSHGNHILEKGNKVLWFRLKLKMYWASLVPQMVKNLPAMQETWVRSLEKGMATHSSILAWKMPWAEEPGGLQSDTTVITLSLSLCNRSPPSFVALNNIKYHGFRG